MAVCGCIFVAVYAATTSADLGIALCLANRPTDRVARVFGFVFDAPGDALMVVMERSVVGTLRDFLAAMPRPQVSELIHRASSKSHAGLVLCRGSGKVAAVAAVVILLRDREVSLRAMYVSVSVCVA